MDSVLSSLHFTAQLTLVLFPVTGIMITSTKGSNEMLNHKEITAQVRKEIKAAGVNALVKMQDSCGSKVIRVDAKAYGVEFSDCDQEKVRGIAISNGLSWVRGLEIEVSQNTNPFNFSFYL